MGGVAGCLSVDLVRKTYNLDITYILAFGIGEQVKAGTLSFWDSPEAMWFIIFPSWYLNFMLLLTVNAL